MRRHPRRATSLAALAVCAAALAALVPLHGASARPAVIRDAVTRSDVVPWGTVLVRGADWAGGAAALGDLNIYSNGTGNEDRRTPYGEGYECVELAVRWAAVRYGEPTTWPVMAASQMWDVGPTMPIPWHRYPNGGGVAPQLGDIIVFAATAFAPYGHVAVVSGTHAGTVDVVEQNWNNRAPTGRATLPIDGTTMPVRAGMPIVGWLRSSTEVTGYWLLAKDGGVFPYGTAVGYGSTGNMVLNQPVVGMAATETGHGYWLVASDGGIFPFGDAQSRSYGSTGNIRLNQPIVAMARTASGHGYYLVASDGGLFPFGDAGAHSYGSTGNLRLNRPIVGMALTETGNGYWLVAADGGLFPFGDAQSRSYGGTGNFALAAPIVSMVSTTSGHGYWLIGADGAVFPFGDAVQHGGGSSTALTAPVVRATRTSSGRGYWMAGADGGVAGFGDAEVVGSMAGKHLNAPMIDMVAAPAVTATPAA